MDINYSRLDEGCQNLCRALNALPGIQTSESCQGHGDHDYWIWFRVMDFQERSLILLSRLMSHNYYEYSEKGWRIVLAHSDVEPQIVFLLEGPSDDVETAEELAKDIMEHIEDRCPYYNILLDKVTARG